MDRILRESGPCPLTNFRIQKISITQKCVTPTFYTGHSKKPEGNTSTTAPMPIVAREDDSNISFKPLPSMNWPWIVNKHLPVIRYGIIGYHNLFSRARWYHLGETEEIVISDYPISNNCVILYTLCKSCKFRRPRISLILLRNFCQLFFG